MASIRARRFTLDPDPGDVILCLMSDEEAGSGTRKASVPGNTRAICWKAAESWLVVVAMTTAPSGRLGLNVGLAGSLATSWRNVVDRALPKPMT